MLYTETVARSTLELLKKLEAERMMVGFNLAGGTSLSLYLGHRLSLDLDLFTPERKFPNSNVIRPFKAITYFDDIDFEEDIVMVNGEYDWRSIEKRLIEMTQIQDKTFEAFPFPKKDIRNR